MPRRPHIRFQPPKLVDIDSLKVEPSFKFDHQYQRLTLLALKKKIKIGLTRIRSDDILSGVVGVDGTVTSNLDASISPLIQRKLQGGARYSVELYWNDRLKRLVCPDDEAILHAYRALGFAYIPARILRPIVLHGRHASLWIEAEGDGIRLCKEVSPAQRPLSGYAGLPEDVPGLVDALINKAERLIKEVQAFHRPDPGGVSYHSFLLAILRRQIRALESISMMVAEKRFEHALAINRMIYEGYLNFYLDWINPEIIGPRLQLLSLIRSSEARGDVTSSDSLSSLGDFDKLFENTKRKAHLSLLGEEYYNRVYAGLSLYVHQTYGLVEQDADLDDDVANVSHESCRALGHQLNVVTLATLKLVANEIGQSPT